MSEKVSQINKIQVKEIFESVQGEGPYIGYKQLFIRLCGCNLNCKYCDTDFGVKESISYTDTELLEEISKHKTCHSVSLTGGEPLLHTDFLKKILPKCELPVYLETNATLSDNLKKIINYIDIVAADIKLPSCSGNGDLWTEHDEFFKLASSKKLFAKIVFDKNITDREIEEGAKLGKKYDIELVLQPKNDKEFVKPDMVFVESVLNKFLKYHKKVRIIPQVHKILKVR